MRSPMLYVISVLREDLIVLPKFLQWSQTARPISLILDDDHDYLPDGDILQGESVTWLPSVVHIVQNALKDGMHEEGVSSLINKVQSVCERLRQQNLFRLLNEERDNEGLKQLRLV
eukprot:gb/GECG01010388.1/.p1 GENE.gb/GECG01010388.1/~~gb/GECG01010388.1/.p1  ORF type:complete len:116 (+),score=14.95 gb/GECG01010388.1/:1-348(+)